MSKALKDHGDGKPGLALPPGSHDMTNLGKPEKPASETPKSTAGDTPAKPKSNGGTK